MSSDTVEHWARCYILSSSLEHKLSPGPPPDSWEHAPSPETIASPGRPPQLRFARSGRGRSAQLNHPAAQAKLLHSFFHHELQAAELMCWALLRFADAEAAFRRGLLKIALDEIRHANAYCVEIERLNFRIGDFAIRDWFWTRVPSCYTKTQFVALMGMGLEAANLEHASHFQRELRSVGAHTAADLQQLIEREERAHVAFATHWFERWTGAIDFETWQRSLPPPLSPLLMKGKTLNRKARLDAGLPEAFVDALERWTP